MNIKQPEISVIVPIYNQELHIGRCIRSIVKQKFYNIEIILVNDGSTDKSLKECQKYAKVDNRIIIIDKHNQGVVLARRDGVLKANGSYIAFVDSDDYLPLDALEVLYKIATEHNVDMVSGNLDSVYDDWDLVKRKSPCLSNSERLIGKEEALQLLLGVQFRGENSYGLQMWGHLYKRTCVLEALEKDNDTLFPPHRVLEDLSFNLAIAPFINSMWNTNSVVYHYRYGGLSKKSDYLVVASGGAYFDKRYNRCFEYGCEHVLPNVFSTYLTFFTRDLSRMVKNENISEKEVDDMIQHELSVRQIVLWAQENLKEKSNSLIGKAIIENNIKQIVEICKKMQKEKTEWKAWRHMIARLYQRAIDSIPFHFS